MNQDRLNLLNELINFIRHVHYVRYMRVHSICMAYTYGLLNLSHHLQPCTCMFLFVVKLDDDNGMHMNFIWFPLY